MSWKRLWRRHVADPRGFLKAGRETPTRRPVDIRIRDYKEVYEPFDPEKLHTQAARCMDCGIPFCHSGCPLGNLIPEWNDLTYRDNWQEAIERLHATNNFPEFTGRLCPAPCESSCVLGINQDPVTIKQVEVSIIDRAWDEGWVKPQLPLRLSGKTVAVIGSGPAGLAAAQQLARAGHTVAVYERADRAGGLLRYGIPEFKMEKKHLDRRIEQMVAEGVRFRTGVEIGVDVTVADLRARYDAIVIAVGATAWRDLDVPGRDAVGVYQAMEYLPLSNRMCEGDYEVSPISAEGKDVVILGGGDTGADCLGTALRQGARSITQLEIMPRPSDERPSTQPWPTYPMIYRVSSAHEEGGERMYAVTTEEFLKDESGNLRGLVLSEVEFSNGAFVPVADSRREITAQLAFLAMGFVGPEHGGLLEQFAIETDSRGNFSRNSQYATSMDGVFVAGDAGRGQSLIVWAIAEGRSAAAAVDAYLMGSTQLPAPIPPTARPLTI
jgi:glutamate synthase (NADPH/NADH) small chain